MSLAANLLTNCRAAGISLWCEGDWLRYKSLSPLPKALLADLSAHKLELLALLNADNARLWRTVPDPEALAEDFEERSGIVQDGTGCDQQAAECTAWKLVYCTRCQHCVPQGCAQRLAAFHCGGFIAKEVPR